ncbi:MAG TPA: phosphate ABC transporter permease PstA [Steroidobacteraceae bacterium]|nr:phosphate ABC transporter permease PstA [Steroidobacteraceae bacterium]
MSSTMPQSSLSAPAAARWLRRQRHLNFGRRLFSIAGWSMSALTLLLLAIVIVWILTIVLMRGWAAMHPSLFTTITQGNGGGLLNAIEGTFVLGIGSLALAVPLGVAAGVYASEYRFTRWSSAIRFLSEVLVGVPSIVLGYFGYVTMVEGLGWEFSVAAGSIVLGIICLPYICRTTELALRQVSDELREAAYALGASERHAILHVCLPAALPGILTGVMLALAISVGETAPLLYTAGWSNYLWDGRLTHSPIGYLTYAIWTFINEPFAAANALAYAAAFLLLLVVLGINILSRFVLSPRP